MAKRVPTNGPVNYRIDSVRFLVCRAGAAATERPTFSQPSDAAALARELIPDDAREHFLALYLNARNGLGASHEVSVGTLSGSLVHPREILGPAFRLLGVGVSASFSARAYRPGVDVS